MSEPYVGEIRMVAFNRTMNGWAPCDGRLLPISEFDVLYALIGTTYGGDGQSTFAVPDLRGRRPLHAGQRAVDGVTYTLGQLGGTETHTLVGTEMPAHTHTVRAAASGALTGPANAVWAPAPAGYGPTAGAVLASGCVTPAAGGQPHENLPPFLTINFQIALTGIFPSQN
jgi:microcystin-dependent protein